MDIVGAHLGWKMLWKGGAGRLGRFVFLFTLMQACIFSPTSESRGLSIEAKCKPVKKYKRTRKKFTSKPVKKILLSRALLQHGGISNYLDPIYYELVIKPNQH